MANLGQERYIIVIVNVKNNLIHSRHEEAAKTLSGPPAVRTGRREGE
jgi:hypothetical protein